MCEQNELILHKISYTLYIEYNFLAINRDI